MEKIKISHTSGMHGDGTMSLYVEGWHGTPGKPIKVSAEYVEKHQPRPGGYHVIEDDGNSYYVNGDTNDNINSNA